MSFFEDNHYHIEATRLCDNCKHYVYREFETDPSICRKFFEVEGIDLNKISHEVKLKYEISKFGLCDAYEYDWVKK